MGGFGFVAGPWIGGKLANPEWLYGSGAFVFAAVAAILNFLLVFFFFIETRKPKAEHVHISPFSTIKDIALVFHHKTMRIILITQLFFLTGWAFFLVFSPTFLVQRFSVDANTIGDFLLTWQFGGRSHP